MPQLRGRPCVNAIAFLLQLTFRTRDDRCSLIRQLHELDLVDESYCTEDLVGPSNHRDVADWRLREKMHRNAARLVTKGYIGYGESKSEMRLCSPGKKLNTRGIPKRGECGGTCGEVGVAKASTVNQINQTRYDGFRAEFG